MRSNADTVRKTKDRVKKFVRYKEGAEIYSMGVTKFQALAKEAKAVYHIKRIVLVNTEKLDEYIEVMYSDDPE